MQKSTRLTRWLFKEKREFSYTLSGVVVHLPGFYPRNMDDVLSVHVTEGLTEDEVWDFGEDLFRKKEPPHLKARADLQESAIIDANVGLRVEHDVEPGEDERHRHIKPWPILQGVLDEEELRRKRAERDDKARALVAIAIPIRKASSI